MGRNLGTAVGIGHSACRKDEDEALREAIQELRNVYNALDKIAR